MPTSAEIIAKRFHETEVPLPTRAEKMAAQYGQKLADLNPATPAPRKVKMSEIQTPEQKEQLRKAKEKLRDFVDLIR